MGKGEGMKQRLDVLVTAKGLAASRQQAQGDIMAGQIFVNGRREDKPGASFEEDAVLEFHGKKKPRTALPSEEMRRIALSHVSRAL